MPDEFIDTPLGRIKVPEQHQDPPYFKWQTIQPHNRGVLWQFISPNPTLLNENAGGTVVASVWTTAGDFVNAVNQANQILQMMWADGSIRREPDQPSG